MQCSSKFETSAEVRSVFFVCQHLRFLDTDAFDTEFLLVLLTLFPDVSEDPIPPNIETPKGRTGIQGRE